MALCHARFQSTPAIADGRTGRLQAGMVPDTMFQSTPAIADGRTWAPRAKAQPKQGFNPRPPSLTGERTVNKAIADAVLVSIHARHR